MESELCFAYDTADGKYLGELRHLSDSERYSINLDLSDRGSSIRWIKAHCDACDGTDDVVLVGKEAFCSECRASGEAYLSK